MIMIDRIIAADMARVEARREANLRIMRMADMDEVVRTAARNGLLQYINNPGPTIDFDDVFRRVGRGLPSIREIADVFLNAPALAPDNTFEVQGQVLAVDDAPAQPPVNASTSNQIS